MWRFVFPLRLSPNSLSHQTRSVFTRIFLWIHRCMNTCNRSRLLFLSARSRRPPNLHILYRTDCSAYCVQPTAELLHIEHKLALLHDNENTNGIENVQTASAAKKFDRLQGTHFFFLFFNTLCLVSDSNCHSRQSEVGSFPRKRKLIPMTRREIFSIHVEKKMRLLTRF